MKQILIFVLIIASIPIYGQKVGVNLSDPEFTLDVRSPSISEPSQFNVSNLDKSRYIRFFSGSEMFPNPAMSWQPNKDFLFATYDDATFTFTEYMRIDSVGNVGIGVIEPKSQLDVKGGDWNLDAGNPGDLRIGSTSHNFRIGVATGGGGAGITRLYSSAQLILGSVNEAQMQIDKDGETGFGTNNPDQKVHVNGKIKIGDDDKAPTEGTIRFNSSNKRYEGYDGTKWINLGGSSPFGNSGTFNLPDTAYQLDVLGEEVTAMAAKGNLIAVRSRTAVPSGIPNVSTYEVHLDLFKQSVAGGNWSNVLRLFSTTHNSGQNFAIGFVLENNFLLVGDPKNKKVRKYAPSGAFWPISHTFSSPNASVNDLYGWSIAYDGGKTMIGAPEIDVNFFPLPASYGPGSAYIYDSSNSLETSLAASGPVSGDGFGFSVDINQNRALVGAPFKDFGSTSEAGSATVFNFFNNFWSTNNTFYNTSVEVDEHYGISVAVESNDYLYVEGEKEGVDLYLVENGFWTLKETISGNGQDPELKSFKTQGVQDLLYHNNPGLNKTPSLVIMERDNVDFFQDVSYLINGNSPIVDYGIASNKIYTITGTGGIYEFRE